MVAGCYGDPLAKTPNLDRLAREGALMESAYCTSPICVPSRMSMLTGRHPYRNDVWTNSHVLDSGIPTFAHALGAAGCRPVLVGRMHALGPDQLHGYAERYVGDHSPNYVGGRPVDRGVLDGTAGPDRVSLIRSGPGQSAYQVHDEYVTAASVGYLNRWGVARRAGRVAQPFCLSVGFMLPHPPYVARAGDYALYAGNMGMPDVLELPEESAPPYLRWWRKSTGADRAFPEEFLRVRTAYWALVTRLDAMIGEILEALRRNGLVENTLIVYTSDHGDMLGEHGLFWKHTFYEESVCVPLIINWPGVVQAGLRCESVVSAVDVTATILDAMGAAPLPGADGRSFLPLIAERARGVSEQPAWENVAYSEYCSDEAWAPEVGCIQRMIRWNDWKLVYYHGETPQLFNLGQDPRELENRATDPDCAEIRDRLIERVLDGWSPGRIAARMKAKREEAQVLSQWASQSGPPDRYRWDLRPEMNYLD